MAPDQPRGAPAASAQGAAADEGSPRRRSLRGRLLRVAAAVMAGCALLAASAVFAWVLIDGPMVKPLVERAASNALGLTVRIGALTLDKGRDFGLRARDIVVENPDWSDGRAAEIAALDVTLRLSSLLGPRLILSRLRIENARVDVAESDAHGVNWAPGQPLLEAVAPEDRPETPQIDALAMRAVVVRYRDMDTDAQRDLTIEQATGAAAGTEGVNLTGEGSLDGAPMSFLATGEDFNVLVAGRDPYAFGLELEADARVSVSGVLGAGADFALADVTVALSGVDLADLAKLTGAPLPATPPYRIDGRLRREAQVYRLTDLRGVVGDSDIAGDFGVDLSGERPRLTGTLRSTRLDFDDLAGVIGAAPDPTETANPAQIARAETGPLIPDRPAPSAALRRFDADIAFTASDVSAPFANVEAIETRIVIDDGRLALSPLSLTIAGGTATGEVALNARDAPPSADIDLSFESVDIRPYLDGLPYVRDMSGPLSGRLYFLGVGETLAELLATARGGGHVVMRDGVVSGLAVELIGLDVVEALGLAIFEDVDVAAPCAAAAISAENGVFRIAQATAVTADSTLVAAGDIDLTRRQLDVTIEARARDFSLIDLSAPIRLSGPLEDVSVAIGGIDPLPFFEMGDENAPSCDAVVDAARRAAPGRP